MNTTRRVRNKTTGAGLAFLLIAAVVTTTRPALGASSSSKATTPSATAGAGGKIVVGVDQDPAELDPAGNMLSFTAISVSNAIYDPLFSVPFGGQPVASLASSLTEAKDRLSWTLKIRPGITFHDGTRLDSAAVVFNLARQKASQLNGNAMKVVTDITAIDPLTVKLAVGKPFVAMPYLLSRSGQIGVMVSPAIITNKTDFKRNPVGAGTGPYLFKEWVPGDHLTVVRNPSYWGTPKPRLDQIIFKVIPDENARLKALKAGDIQSMTSVLPASATDAKAAGLAVVVPPVAGYGIVLLNNAVPPVNDVTMRQAAALAVDSAILSKFLQDPNYAKRGFGLWPTDSPWYSAPDKPLSFDLAAAKKLIVAYTAKNKAAPKFAYLGSSISQQGTDTAKLLQKFWKAAGFDVDLQLVADGNQIVLAVVFGGYTAAGFVAGLAADPDPTAYPVLHSTSSFNFAKYKNAEMDAALDEGRSSPDLATRKAAYAKVQQIFRRDVPFLIGSPATVRVISSPKLCGVDTSGFFPARTVGFSC